MNIVDEDIYMDLLGILLRFADVVVRTVYIVFEYSWLVDSWEISIGCISGDNSSKVGDLGQRIPSCKDVEK